MAKLTTARRNALPSKSFVYPGARKFPINDASHARNALSRASAKGPAVLAKVRAAVHAKYPSIGQAGKAMRGTRMGSLRPKGY